MPSTITTFYTFTAATKARASQVNANFDNFRGDILPINETSASASDSTHHLGAPDHRWLRAYINYADFKGATSTNSIVIRGDSSATAGGMLVQIASTTVGKWDTTGYDGAYMKPGSIVDAGINASTRILVAVTITSTQVWTVPAGIVNLLAAVIPAGGGGGGGGGGAGASQSGGGGAGGKGSQPHIFPLAVTPGVVLSITVGTGGTGANGGNVGVAGNSGASGGASAIYNSGTQLILLPGMPGGQGGGPGTAGAGPGGAASSDSILGPVISSGAGNGGTPSLTSAGTGTNSPYADGGSPGSQGAGNVGGGGGGGGASYGKGGNGANGSTGTGANASDTPGYGGGGGGGAGGGINNVGGTGMNGGNGLVVLFYVK